MKPLLILGMALSLGAAALSPARAQTQPGAGPALIRPGQTVNGALEASDHVGFGRRYEDGFLIELAAGQVVRITLTTPRFDPFLSVEDPDDRQVDSDESGSPAKVEFTAKVAGTYFILVSSEAPATMGAYTLVVAGPGPAASSAAAAAGQKPKFTIDAQGNIALTDAFTSEAFCVLDTIDDATATAAGDALAAGLWPAPVDATFQAAKARCTAKYNWSPGEGDLAIIVSSTQTLLNRNETKLGQAGLSDTGVAAVVDTLSQREATKFRDGTWLQDPAMVAKVQNGIRGQGLKGDANLLTTAEVSVGALSNQRTTLRAWVDVLKGK